MDPDADTTTNGYNNNDPRAMDIAAQYANPKHFNAYASTPPRRGAGGGGGGGGGGGSVSATSSATTVPHGAAGGGPPPSGRSVVSDDSPSGSGENGPGSGGDPRAQVAQRLSQYTRGADRRQVLRTLADRRLVPRAHPLRPVWVEDIAAAEREAASERATLNGVKFLKLDPAAAGAASASGEGSAPSGPVDSYFLQTLREICGHMCDMDGVDADPMALYGGLLLRLSRSTSERDALAALTPWSSARGELVLLPLGRRHHRRRPDANARGNTPQGQGGSVGSRTPPPVEVELYVESGSVHAKVTMRHELGLHLRSSLEQSGLRRELSPWNALVVASAMDGNNNATVRESSHRRLAGIQRDALASPKFGNPKPWIFVDADVVERINFGTGGSVRMLHVRLPEDKNSGYVKKW